MNIRLQVALVLAGVLACAGTSSAQEKKIKRADLPPAVEKTVAAESAGATVKGFSTEKEKGETFYEAELVVNGHSKDVLIDASGAVVRDVGIREPSLDDVFLALTGKPADSANPAEPGKPAGPRKSPEACEAVA